MRVPRGTGFLQPTLFQGIRDIGYRGVSEITKPSPSIRLSDDLFIQSVAHVSLVDHSLRCFDCFAGAKERFSCSACEFSVFRDMYGHFRPLVRDRNSEQPLVIWWATKKARSHQEQMPSLRFSVVKQ